MKTEIRSKNHWHTRHVTLKHDVPNVRTYNYKKKQNMEKYFFIQISVTYCTDDLRKLTLKTDWKSKNTFYIHVKSKVLYGHMYRSFQPLFSAFRKWKLNKS